MQRKKIRMLLTPRGEPTKETVDNLGAASVADHSGQQRQPGMPQGQELREEIRRRRAQRARRRPRRHVPAKEHKIFVNKAGNRSVTERLAVRSGGGCKRRVGTGSLDRIWSSRAEDVALKKGLVVQINEEWKACGGGGYNRRIMSDG